LRLRLPGAVKRVTTPLLGRIPIRIASGANKGLRWSLATAGSGYGSGRRERAQLAALAQLIHVGDDVWDVGAHCGFVTLFASRRVGSSGRVHAFEPGASSRWFLQRHVKWNRMTNVTILPYALGAFDGPARFGGGTTSKQARIDGGDSIVPVRTIESLLDTRECGLPTFLKVDVEGAEADLLGRGIQALDPATRLVLAVHSAELYQVCTGLLESAAYRTYESTRLRRYRCGGWRGDADLVAFGPSYSRADRDFEALRALEY
jgi:FkbM family methyltransferase